MASVYEKDGFDLPLLPPQITIFMSRRLSFSAVGAEQTEYRSALHGEIQMIDHRFAIIGFGQSFYKNSFAHSEILRTARSSM